MRRLLTFFLVSVVYAIPASAQVVDTQRGDSAGAQWTVVPIFFSSPDTRVGIGAVPHVVFRTAPDARKSSAKLEASYTQNDQFNVRISTNLWLPSNEYGVDAKVQYQYWPSSFYGIGNNISRDRKEKYSSTILVSTTEFQQQLQENLYAGFRHDIRHDAIDEFEEGGLLDEAGIRGSDGGISVGFGVFGGYDSRDEALYPTEGNMLRAGARLFLRAWGSDFNYARYRLDARAYTNFGQKRVIAGQFVGAFATGEPPFQMYSTVGELLRAYGSSRYIDKNMLAVRLEYRHTPVIWRFGYALFIGAGQVSPTLGAFDVGSVHLSAGAGVRFLLLKAQQVVIRWDFAVGTRTTGTYLDIGEAF